MENDFEKLLIKKELVRNRAFILSGAHLPSNHVARYITLDKNVDLIIFLKKPEWPKRAREECFRCGRCHCYIKPKESKIEKENTFYHKAACTPKFPVIEKEEPVQEKPASEMN